MINPQNDLVFGLLDLLSNSLIYLRAAVACNCRSKQIEYFEITYANYFLYFKAKSRRRVCTFALMTWRLLTCSPEVIGAWNSQVRLN